MRKMRDRLLTRRTALRGVLATWLVAPASLISLRRQRITHDGWILGRNDR